MRSGPEAGTQTGNGSKKMRGGSAAKRDRLLRPRARLARVGGYAVSLDAAHGLDNTGRFQRVPRYRDDTSGGPGQSPRAPAASTSSGQHGPPRRGECATTCTVAVVVAGAGEHQHARAGARHHRSETGSPKPADQVEGLRHGAAALALVQPVLGGASSRTGRRQSVHQQGGASRLAAASACGKTPGSSPRAWWVASCWSGTRTTGWRRRRGRLDPHGRRGRRSGQGRAGRAGRRAALSGWPSNSRSAAGRRRRHGR